MSFDGYESLVCCWELQASRVTNGAREPWRPCSGPVRCTGPPGLAVASPADVKKSDSGAAASGAAPGAGSGAGSSAFGAATATAASGAGAAGAGGVDVSDGGIAAATGITSSGGTAMVTCARGSCVRIGTTAQLGLVDSSYTVETWVRLHEYSGDAGEQRDNAILGSDTCAAHQTLHVVLRSANPYFGHYCDDCSSAVPLPRHEWHHLACVYDKLMAEMLIYVDGRQVCREKPRRPLEGSVQLNVGRYAGEMGVGRRCRA